MSKMNEAELDRLFNISTETRAKGVTRSYQGGGSA